MPVAVAEQASPAEAARPCASSVIGLAYLAARRAARRRGRLADRDLVEDLAAAAMLAACKAVARFRPELGYKWSTFAGNAMEFTLRRVLGRDHLIPGPHHAPERAPRAVSIQALTRRMGDDDEPFCLADNRDSVMRDRREAEAHARALLAPAMLRLPHRQRRVVEMVDLAGETYEAAGAALRCSRERARQIRLDALEALRVALSNQHPEATNA